MDKSVIISASPLLLEMKTLKYLRQQTQSGFLFRVFRTNSEAAACCVQGPLRSTVGRTTLTFRFPDVPVSGEESGISDNRRHKEPRERNERVKKSVSLSRADGMR